MNGLTMLLLAAACLLTRIVNLKTAVYVLVFQSLLVTLACFAAGMETGEWHMYIAAFLTAIIKVGIIPYALFGIARRMTREREANPILSVNGSSLAACLAIILSFGLVAKTLPGLVRQEDLAAAVALVLIGLLLIVARRQAVMQIIGLMTMENGLYLLGLSVTKGLPLIIELGIFFDVLVAAIVLVLLTYRLKMHFSSTDTTMLKRLKG